MHIEDQSPTAALLATGGMLQRKDMGPPQIVELVFSWRGASELSSKGSTYGRSLPTRDTPGMYMRSKPVQDNQLEGTSVRESFVGLQELTLLR